MTSSENDLIRAFVEDGAGRHTFGVDGRSFEERFGNGEAFELVVRHRGASPELSQYADLIVTGINQSLGETDKAYPKVPTATKVAFEAGIYRNLHEALGLVFEAAGVPSEDKILAGNLRSALK